MVRTKVFVGNLSFKTTEAQLAQEFKAAGTVVSANIITRGPRSLGYGFVELENEEDAKNSVKVMNKKEIDGRQINVEVAKPREEEPQSEEGQQGNSQNFRGRGRGGFRGGFRGSFRGRGRGFSSPKQSFRPRNQEEGSQTTDRVDRVDRPEREQIELTELTENEHPDPPIQEEAPVPEEEVLVSHAPQLKNVPIQLLQRLLFLLQIYHFPSMMKVLVKSSLTLV